MRTSLAAYISPIVCALACGSSESVGDIGGLNDGGDDASVGSGGRAASGGAGGKGGAVSSGGTSASSGGSVTASGGEPPGPGGAPTSGGAGGADSGTSQGGAGGIPDAGPASACGQLAACCVTAEPPALRPSCSQYATAGDVAQCTALLGLYCNQPDGGADPPDAPLSGCAALAACCPSLGPQRASCEQLVSTGVVGACDVFRSSLCL